MRAGRSLPGRIGREQPGRRRLLGGLAGAFAAGAVPGGAAPDPALFDIRRYVYVPGAATPEVTVIDGDSNTISGQLHIGVVARQVLVSREAETLVASDGVAAALTLLDVFGGRLRTVALPAPAARLTLGSRGRLVAAYDPAGSSVTVADIGKDRVERVITGLPPLRDVMFGGYDRFLFIAAEGLDGVGVIDLAAGRLSRMIPGYRPVPAGFAALARTPDGRRLLALPQGGGPISLLDPEQEQPAAAIAAGPGALGLFPSGTGSFLLVPDNASATLAVFRAAGPGDPVALPAAGDVTAAYTAWLDSVAFLPCATGRRLLVYDLDAPRLVGELGLPGVPVRGAVTADSRTLYLPLLDPPQVVAVEGATRQVVATLPLPGPPLAALVAGGWGICH